MNRTKLGLSEEHMNPSIFHSVLSYFSFIIPFSLPISLHLPSLHSFVSPQLLLSHHNLPTSILPSRFSTLIRLALFFSTATFPSAVIAPQSHFFLLPSLHRCPLNSPLSLAPSPFLCADAAMTYSIQSSSDKTVHQLTNQFIIHSLLTTLLSACQHLFSSRSNAFCLLFFLLCTHGHLFSVYSRHPSFQPSQSSKRSVV